MIKIPAEYDGDTASAKFEDILDKFLLRYKISLQQQPESSNE
jgi:hypothetical protein